MIVDAGGFETSLAAELGCDLPYDSNPYAKGLAARSFSSSYEYIILAMFTLLSGYWIFLT